MNTKKLVSGFALFVALNTASIADTPTSVLKFPSEQAVGKYVLVDENVNWRDIESDRSISKQVKPAQGQVPVPGDKRVALILSGQRSNGKRPFIEAIDHLQETSLLSVSFAFCDLLPTDLTRFSRHRGLKTFAITLSRLDDAGLVAVCESAKQ